jgi:hypothetical protein
MAFEHGITRNPLPIIEHNGVFDRVVVMPHTRGGSVVTFWLDSRRFVVAGPYTFYLEWAEHPDADFEEIAGPTSENTLTDSEQRRFSKLPHSVYRVRVTTPSGDFYSAPHLVMGNWNRHDYLVAREVVRREYLLLARYSGTRGIYLGRKQWGEICTACADYNTDMPTDSHCTTCYGTGFVGGYHSPSVLYLGEDRLSVRAERKENIGVVNDQMQTVRAVACPFLTAKDVWANLETGERWSIERKRELVALRGAPLVWAVEIRMIEPNAIEYDIPLESSGDASSSSS